MCGFALGVDLSDLMLERGERGCSVYCLALPFALALDWIARLAVSGLFAEYVLFGRDGADAAGC